MTEELFIISGAREHNLKNISLRVPKCKITVFTGVSGSGKSSLVFDTIAAEAQRQLNAVSTSAVASWASTTGVAGPLVELLSLGRRGPGLR